MAWTGDSILDLAREFMRCRILLTGAELDVFSLLAREVLSATAVAQRLKTDARGTTVLLDALAALGLLAKQGGAYRCEPDVAAHLAADATQTALPMVLHDAGLWRRWSELTGIVRGDAAARARAQTPRSDVGMRAFIGAMHVVAAPVAREVVARVAPGHARRLLDIGGGSGTYTIAFLNAAPEMRATLFDFPAVVEMARERLAAAGLIDRVQLVSGDFEREELPGGHDLALLSAIIHQNSRAQNVELFGKVWRALVSGGRVVVRDHVMKNEHTAPPDGAIFAINMLVGTGGGGTYTYEEIRGDLETAGFRRARCIRDDAGMNSLVEAWKD